VDEQNKGNIFTEDPRLKEARDLAVDQNAPLKSQPQALNYLLRPQQVGDSLYHLYISKNLPITNLTPQDIPFVMLFEDTINLALYMESRHIVISALANDLASLADTWFNAKRAVDMKTFKAVAENTVNVRQLTETAPQPTQMLRR
jgi:hypothetical protein